MNKQKNELPTKEATLFKQILKQYEFKQYKKGFKNAEKILKKFPEHGETLAVKGLFLSHLNRKEEGYEFVRKGLKLNLTSYICWHVFGIMNRADKNYGEALKCYRNALRFDQENVQIHRDISLLQIQIRNYLGYNESAMTLLDLRPQTRAYWVGLSVSYQLLGELDMAIQVLNYFEEFSSGGPTPILEYEHSELLIYKNYLLLKAERYNDVLINIEKIRPLVYDQRALKEDRALALLRLKRVEEATLAYQELLKTNPDSKFYIERLLECDNLLGDLNEEDQQRLVVKFEDLCRDYPRSHLLKFMPLSHLKDESFKNKVKEYLKSNLRKGVPSLFSNLKNLYSDLSKRTTIEELVISFLDNLNKESKFESGDQIEEPITAKLWTLYYLSQHYNKIGNFELAHKYIDQAIDHTPTLVELVKTKAQIYKHQGDLEKAMDTMNEARELDLQDRYINTKCTKYMLRNGKFDQAVATITMFERPDAVDKLKDLTEIQSIWFMAEAAKSFFSSNQLGQALKKVYQVDKYYNVMKDDQFDFHSYCMRKLTMRAYSEMLEFEDRLHDYHYYFNNAKLGVDCYLSLHDDPTTVKANNDPLTSGQLSEGAKKKLRKKQRQAQEKDAKTKANDKSGKDKVVDEDPIGTKLLDEDKPLEKAQYFVNLLLHYSPDKVDSHLKAFEVYLRKEKLLLALRSLVNAAKIDSTHTQIAVNKGRAAELLNKLKADLAPEIVQVVESQLSQL